MSFLYPIGLLGLLGIPILIIIYIIKSKYTEQTVASTYLWTLSERFLKRKNPVSKLTNLISLILQLLAVVLISLLIAHPVFTLRGSAREYCFILDGSGSMAMTEDGVSRFDSAKEKIRSVIKDSSDGSRYTLVYIGESTSVIYEGTADKEEAITLLEERRVSDSEAGFTDALGIAQGYFNENPGLKTYLMTDTYFSASDNVEIVNFGSNVDNYSISDLNYTLVGGRLNVSGNLFVSGNAATLGLKLYVDGAEEPTDSQTVVAPAFLKTPFYFSVDANDFESVRVVIDTADALKEDNEAMLFNLKSDKAYSILVVSEAPFFLKTVLSSVASAKIDVITPDEYINRTGYGLYVFDSYTPSAMPKDGSVWFINPTASLPEAGFSVQGAVEFESGEELELSGGSSSLSKQLTDGMKGKGIAVSGYTKCGTYRKFTTILSYKENPVVFAGTNTYGNREAVIGFDIHNSNIALLSDFIFLTKNLVNYSFPDVLTKSDYHVGEEVTVNLLANTSALRIDSPDGNITYLDTSSAVAGFTPLEAGVYKITATVSGNDTEFLIYSAFPEAERIPIVASDQFIIQGEPSDGGFDGVYDNLTLFFIALALVFSADWMVYCYEKYQLR